MSALLLTVAIVVVANSFSLTINRHRQSGSGFEFYLSLLALSTLPVSLVVLIFSSPAGWLFPDPRLDLGVGLLAFSVLATIVVTLAALARKVRKKR